VSHCRGEGPIDAQTQWIDGHGLIIVPPAAWPLVAAVAEQLDRDRSLEGEQQLVGVRVHLPRTGARAGRASSGSALAMPTGR
jgi:hypothetical protein